MTVAEPLPLQPEASAKLAGLRHVTDDAPGLRRIAASRKSFRYLDAGGHPVRDAATLARIRSLAIPPAWTRVWICADPLGHVQATGRDAKGRKQYRYHPRWRAVRDETKYDKLVAFGRALPRIRKAVDRDLARPGLPREKVLATVVRLLERTLIRVGNEEYAKANRSYGLTTLTNRHVDVHGSTLRFRFRGKSGVHHEVELDDPRIASVVRRCRELPGHALFEYVGDDGALSVVDSGDVNDYLRAVSGEELTAKDFRTWSGTVLAAQALAAIGAATGVRATKRNIASAIERVAGSLGNTKSVCRKSYVHPHVLDAYTEGALLGALEKPVPRSLRRECPGLRAHELAVLALLQRARREERSRADVAGALRASVERYARPSARRSRPRRSGSRSPRAPAAAARSRPRPQSSARSSSRSSHAPSQPPSGSP